MASLMMGMVVEIIQMVMKEGIWKLRNHVPMRADQECLK